MACLNMHVTVMPALVGRIIDVRCDRCEMAMAGTRGTCDRYARGTTSLWRGRRTRDPGVAASRSLSLVCRPASPKPHCASGTPYNSGERESTSHSRATAPRSCRISVLCAAQTHASRMAPAMYRRQWLRSGPPRHWRQSSLRDPGKAALARRTAELFGKGLFSGQSQRREGRNTWPSRTSIWSRQPP